MVVGGAPPFALIVEDAARIETKIAADCAHVAMGRAGDMRGRLSHHRIVAHHVWMRGEFGERDRSADFESAGVGLDGAQFVHAVDIDELGRRDDAAADVDHKVGTAAKQSAFGIRRARRDHLVERARMHECEFRERIHQLPPFRLRPTSRARFTKSTKTRSGVTGRSLNRNPVASAIVLVNAGRNAASEPSPASLAPNGPCGSMLSTMPTSIGGESWMVGTR